MLALLQGLRLPWVRVDLTGTVWADPHGLTARFFAPCLQSAACAHVVNVTAFVLLSAYVTLLVLRASSNAWMLALVAGVAIATSPFAAAILVNADGAETFVTIALFVTMVADAAGILRLKLPVKCALQALLVLQDPLFVISALLYTAYSIGRNRARAVLISVALASATLAVILVPGSESAIRHTTLSNWQTQGTIILIALTLFVIAPAITHAEQSGIASRLGIGTVRPHLYWFSIAALLQGLMYPIESVAAHWFCAEAAFVLAVSYSLRPAAVGVRTAAVLATLLIASEGAAYASIPDLLRFEGVSHASTSLSTALFTAKPHETVCLWDAKAYGNAVRGTPLIRRTIYGPVTLVSSPWQCLALNNSDSVALIGGSGGHFQNWSTGGAALLRANLAQRHSRIDLMRGPDRPHGTSAGDGVFAQEVDSPGGAIAAFTVVNGSRQTFGCAWRGGGKHVSFAAGNPLQAYSSTTPVAITITALWQHHRVVLVRRQIAGAPLPISWSYHDTALPNTGHSCGALEFSVTPLTSPSYGTWATFVGPSVR